jgi:Flp pilus assembly protein TadD
MNGRYGEAAAQFRRIIELQPADAQARANLAAAEAFAARQRASGSRPQ